MSLVELTSTERKLAERIDQGVTGDLAISDRVGGIAFVSMDQVMEFAKLMAISSIAVPKHLRGNAGACLAICIQALEWQMSPYSVANKSYSVNDRISYEAQLIEAVILRRAPIKGRPKIEYDGEGDKRQCRIWAELRDEPGEIVDYQSPPFGKITPKNSPLWKGDPDQQHFYYSVRAWCRRHFPDVLLGVYARDEIEDAPPLAAAVGVTRPKSLAGRLDALAAMADKPAAATGETVDAETGEITGAAADPQNTPQPEQATEAIVDHTETEGEIDLATEEFPDEVEQQPPREPDELPRSMPMPTDEQSYRAYCEWRIGFATNAEDLKAWFLSGEQKNLRATCHVSKSAFDAVQAAVKAAISRLSNKQVTARQG